MIDLETLERLVSEYIAKNFREPAVPRKLFAQKLMKFAEPDKIDFRKLRTQKYDGETFSEMLLRLIDESGEKNPSSTNAQISTAVIFSKSPTTKTISPASKLSWHSCLRSNSTS